MNVAAGTEVLVTVTDSLGRTGGNSDISPIIQTGDTTCLTGTFPSSTFAPSSTSVPGSTATSSSAPSSSNATTISGGTIGAIIAAVLVGFGAIIALTLFWRKHRQETSRYGRRPRQRVDLGYVPEPYTLAAPNAFGTELYDHSPSSSTALVNTIGGQIGHQDVQNRDAQSQRPLSEYEAHGRHRSISTTMTDPFAATSRSSKIAALREQAQRRYVLHTDAADESEGDDVIELPPQYSENRRPIPGMPHYEPSLSSASDSKGPR
ncbi:hypothetical protein K488DRAFT_69900 [Vararia minispora EC-137]|uniref:Uncharacterized protein n=1 Tax=Vararia minispora EC-137 TaxID=1314806 RepID=A0ACB8QPK9_9AGAM|nr:hypothetical protein K488DRAFT_69900 [Vararia minispora EC-137]